MKKSIHQVTTVLQSLNTIPGMIIIVVGIYPALKAQNMQLRPIPYGNQ
jgi:hypothetical protein